MNDKRRWIIVRTFFFVIGVAAAACGGDDGGASAPSTNTSTSASIAPSTTTTTSTTSVAPSTSASTPTTTVSLSTTTTTRGAVPNTVEVINAGPGGGSGEITLRWNAVANVTGYRVLRADAPSGPFSVNADFNITTGKTTAGADVTNVWSQQYSYKPTYAAFGPPDSSLRFEYVEIISGGVVRHYFRVVAYNANGDAPASVVVCGDPNGHPAC